MARVSVGTNGASVSTKQGDSKNSVRTTVSVNKKGKVTTTNTVKTGNVSTRLKNGKVTGVSFSFGSSSSKKKKTK